MPILHAYSLTQADGTATSVVRPSDWNSVHNLAFQLSGNTVGSSQVSGSNVVFVGGNNVTLSADTANSRLAFSAANQTQQPMAFSAGGASSTANTLQFANSNGLSFGLTNGSISASYTVPTQSAQPVAVSGSNGSFAFSTLSMGASNGLTFYTTNGSVVGSYTVPAAQTTQTQAAGNIAGAGYTSTTQAGSTVGVTHDSNGLSAAWPPFLTTSPAQTVQPVAVSGSNGSFAFSTLTLGNLNGVSFYTSNGSVVASYTVPSQTVQPVAVSGSNGSFAFSTLTLGASNGLTFYTTNGSVVGSYTVPSVPAGATATGNFGALAGGTQTATSGTVNFANSNGITFGMSGSSQVTASFSSVVFSNSNNVSFGLNGSTLTATATFAQSAQPVAVSGSNGSFAFSTLTLGNLNGVSFYTSNGSVVASYTVPTQTVQPVAYSAANGSAAFSTLTFANSNGVSFSTGTQGLFASVKTDYLTTAALSDHSHGNPTLALTNLNGTTASNSAGLTLSLSAAAQSVQPVAYSAANGSAVFSTLTFANSNGVSFSSGTQGLFATVKTDYLTTARASNDAVGLNTALTGNGVAWTVNSSGISLSVPAFLTTAALSDHSHGNPTLALTNLSGTTASNSAGFTLSLSAALGGGAGDGYNFLAAGTQTAGTANTVNFANSNGVSFGMSASSQITASFSTLPAATNVNDVGSAGSTGTSLAYAPADHVHAGVVRIYPGSTTGNTAGNTGGQHGNWVIAGTNNVTISGSSGPAGVHTLWVSGPTLTPYLTTARASNDAVGLNSALTAGPVAVTMNSSGLSMNFASVAGTSTGFTGGASIGGSMTHNTAGLALSLSHPAWITTARASNDAVGLNTALTGNGVAWTVNSSGISLNVPAFLTTAALSNHSHGNPTLALTNLNGTTASASNGLTLSLSAASQSNQTLSMAAVGNTTGNTSGLSVDARSVSFQGLGAASIGMSTSVGGSSVLFSVPVQSVQTQASGNIAGVGTTFNGANVSGSMTLNSNGLNLSLSAAAGGGGNTANLYVSGNTTQLSSTAAIDIRSLSFEGAGIASIGVSNGRVLVSVPAGGGGGDGYNIVQISGNTTGTANTYLSGTIALAGGNNVTLSQSSNSISINAPASSSLAAGANITIATAGNTISIIGGASPTMSAYEPTPLIGTSLSSFGQNTLNFTPFKPPQNVSATNIRMLVSLNNATSSISHAVSQTISYGVYVLGSGTNSSRIESMATSSIAFRASYSSNLSGGYTISQGTNSTTYSSAGTGSTSAWTGQRLFELPFATSFAAGSEYYFCIAQSTASVGNTGAFRMSHIVLNNMTNGSFGRLGPAGNTVSSASIVLNYAGFIYTATSAAWPNTIALSQRSINSNVRAYFQFDA